MKDKSYRNFIIFWASQAVSQLGSSMTGFAIIIWAYKQTNSAMTVSMLTFFSYLPYIVISLFAGSFVDKHKKKTILLCSDGVAFLYSVGIVVLLITGRLQIWHIYIANTITGFMNSFQSPASSVAVGILVPKDKLSNASGMSSLSSSMLSVITPMLASFIKIPESINHVFAVKSSILKICKEEFSYLLKHKGLWNIILSMAMINFFSRLTYENIMPAMLLARSGGNDNVLGIVSGLIGAGGIVGAIYVSFFKLPKNSIKVIYFSVALSFLFGDLLMGLGKNLAIWCFASLSASVPLPFINAAFNGILYNNIPTNMQGRIFAVQNAV